MMDAVMRYLRQLIAASFLVSVARAAFPARTGGKAIGLVCGLLLFVSASGVLMKLDAGDLAAAISRWEMNNVEAGLNFSVDNTEIVSDIIKEKAETYILDQGKELGANLKVVSVVMEKGGEYPYPAAVEITGCFTVQQRIELTGWIITNLAIPETHQNWIAETD